MSPEPSPSDESLALSALSGSSVCFEALVQRYQVRVLRYVARSLSTHDAEDIAQDTFVRAYVNLAKFNPRYRFKTWLFVIAQRLTTDRLRKRKSTDAITERASTSPSTSPALSPSLVSAIIERERAERVWHTVRDTLGDDAMRAVWLFYVEEASTRDIALVLGRSWVWVKTTLHRSRKKLAGALASEVSVRDGASPRAQNVTIELSEALR